MGIERSNADFWEKLSDEERVRLVANWLETCDTELLPGIVLTRARDMIEYNPFSPSDMVDPNVVRNAFETAIAMQELHPDKRGRHPTRIRKMYEVIEGRENETILIQEFAAKFATKDDQKTAANMFSILNDIFYEHRLGIKVETIRSPKAGKLTTGYRIKNDTYED